jgi:hypothetical protein
MNYFNTHRISIALYFEDWGQNYYFVPQMVCDGGICWSLLNLCFPLLLPAELQFSLEELALLASSAMRSGWRSLFSGESCTSQSICTKLKDGCETQFRTQRKGMTGRDSSWTQGCD